MSKGQFGLTAGGLMPFAEYDLDGGVDWFCPWRAGPSCSSES